MRLARLNILFLNLFIFNFIYAQEYLPPELLSVDKGLKSGQVNSLIIDQQGYLWAGTSGGLSRYSGYGFTHFFTSGTTNGYPGIQKILRVRKDNVGNIWVLNEGGINRIDYKTGDITRFPSSGFDAAYIHEALLTDAWPSDDGTAWILTDRSLTMISPEQVINTYPIPPELLSNSIPVCVISDNRDIWIGTTKGLLLFSVQQRIFKEIVGENVQDMLSNNAVTSFFLDHKNSLWVGTQNGLNRVDPVDFSFYQFYPAGSRAAHPRNHISDIVRGSDNEFIISTGAGIVRFNETEQEFTNVYSSTSDKINSVATDSFGIVWAGTTNGILKIRKAKLTLRNFSAGTEGFKLTQNEISALLAHDQRNLLFIGYDKDGFSVTDLETKAGTHYKTFDNSRVVNFYPFHPEEYLVLCEHDIEVFIPGGRRASLFDQYSFLNRDLINDVKINCLFYDGESALWLGTSSGIQCIRFDSAMHYSRNQLTSRGQQITIGEVYDIKSDESGNLWMGTENGLLLYNPAKGNFNRYTPYDINLLNTEHKAVYKILPGISGIFWLGTSGGAYRFDIKNRVFKALTSKPEIMNAGVKALNIDGKGNIWIGTETGLFEFDKRTNTIKSFDQKDGLINDSYKAIASGAEDMVYFGGPRGLSVITLSDTVTHSSIPNIVITGIRYIENKPDYPDLYYHVPDTIVLPWQRKSIIIEFAAMDYYRPELNQYRYSFERTRKEASWHNLGSQNHVILDRLPPGIYRFTVTGAGSESVWNNRGTSVIIRVEAPYWRSWYGVALMIIGGLALIFLFFRFWIRQFFTLSRENQEREMFAKQIILQKEELTLKNKAITDSINYAKRIQTAMLPPYKLFKSIFPSSFILFMPKDIVSGDFYWVNKVGNRIFIAAVDCTGHGVPGAFMSIIGFELFRKITNIEGLTRPSDILNRLNDDFHEIFKDVDNAVLRDGMDVAFCSIDKKDMILEFAGAFNPLYLIRDNKIMEIKGDRFAIGLDEINFREQTFKNHIIPIQKSDIIYVFSDGFADQFGGPDGKKYKYRRFRHLLLNLHQLPMEKQHEILENNVMEWRGEQDQVDDILVIGIKIDF